MPLPFIQVMVFCLKTPILLIIPLIAVASLVLVKVFAAKGQNGTAFTFSCLTIVFVVFTGVTGLFPNLIPSSLDPASNLTIYNSSSSPLTLKIMTVVALIFVPIVLITTALVIALPPLFGKAKALRRILRTDRVDRAGVLFVGDELRDLDAGRKARVATAAVTWTPRPRARPSSRACRRPAGSARAPRAPRPRAGGGGRGGGKPSPACPLKG